MKKVNSKKNTHHKKSNIAKLSHKNRSIWARAYYGWLLEKNPFPKNNPYDSLEIIDANEYILKEKDS